LTEKQMSATLSPLGLGLPVEARVWWGWHDGANGQGLRKPLAPVGGRLLSLAQAVDAYKLFKRSAERGVEPDIPALANPDDRWHPAWLPIVGPQHPIVVDCSVPQGEPTPLRLIDLADVEGSPRIRAGSLGEMIALWNRALDDGGWRWDSERGRWEVRRELMDEDYRMSALV
jgi:cell wall assembly regulator SMI1